ncbi:MAG: hypothetical protein Q4G28_02495 [Neisseria sp.]|nr:hypothetical protein [Neisseria sp.]
MNEQWLAALLVAGVSALSVHLSWITWRWFFRWKAHEALQAGAAEKEMNAVYNRRCRF